MLSMMLIASYVYSMEKDEHDEHLESDVYLENIELLREKFSCADNDKLVKTLPCHITEKFKNLSKEDINSIFDDVGSLHELIPSPDIPCLRFHDYVVSVDDLDERAIENQLTTFCIATPKKWQQLSAGTQKELTRSHFYTLRAKILNYFEKRIESYHSEATCLLNTAIGGSCCLCGCSQTVAAVPLLALFDPLTGAWVLATGLLEIGLGGVSCLFCEDMAQRCAEIDRKSRNIFEKQVDGKILTIVQSINQAQTNLNYLKIEGEVEVIE